MGPEKHCILLYAAWRLPSSLISQFISNHLSAKKPHNNKACWANVREH